MYSNEVKRQPKFSWTVANGPDFPDLFFATFQFSRKKVFLAAILGNMCLRISQADLGIEAARFRVTPHTSPDEINDSAVRSERGELVRGSDPPLVYSSTVLTLSPVICSGRRPGCCSKNTWRLVVWKTETKTLHRLPTGKKRSFQSISRKPIKRRGQPFTP